MRARGFGATDTGRRRDHNEDVYEIDETLGLYIVADGMGGHNAGEVASRLAVDHVLERLRGDELLNSPMQRQRLPAQFLEARVRAVIATANTAVFEAGQRDQAHAGMGCTLTLVWVVGDRAIVGHVGDSRAYLWRHHALRQLTTDHTMAQVLVDSGAMSAADAHESHHAHTLTQGIGIEPSVEVDVMTIALMPGDRLLICSDGLSDYAPTADKLEAQLAESEADGIPEALVAFANDRGGRDNITAVVVEIDGAPFWAQPTAPTLPAARP